MSDTTSCLSRIWNRICTCLAKFRSYVGNKGFVCPEEEFTYLRNNTTLRPGQINYLYRRFCSIGRDGTPPKHLLRQHFVSVGRLEGNPILSIILNAMFGDRKTLNFTQFATFISNFQGNTLNMKKEQIQSAKERRLRLLFSMYDCNKDGVITVSDLITIVHKLYGDLMNTENVLQVVNTIMSEMEDSSPNEILFQDFCNSLNVFDMEETMVVKINE